MGRVLVRAAVITVATYDPRYPQAIGFVHCRIYIIFFFSVTSRLDEIWMMYDDFEHARYQNYPCNHTRDTRYTPAQSWLVFRLPLFLFVSPQGETRFTLFNA